MKYRESESQWNRWNTIDRLMLGEGFSRSNKDLLSVGHLLISFAHDEKVARSFWSSRSAIGVRVLFDLDAIMGAGGGCCANV